ncbi:MAG: host-nuclease inhibitor Gam family protein [Taibaiella sp.]|nr:host-nuclease inhibitor Gam family protein [Taibaiella sp.]
MKTRNISKVTQGITEEQFAAAMERYAAAEAREQEINKRIECEVNDLLEKYEDELLCLAQGKQTAFDIAQSYCRENKAALFVQRRSIGTVHGIAGFRLGTPQLKTLKGGNWNKVLQQLKEKLPDYVRTTEEPARNLLLAHRHQDNVAPLLVEIGVQVVQDELFYIEPRKAA